MIFVVKKNSLRAWRLRFLWVLMLGIWSFSSRSADILFRDDFTNGLASGWSWLREDPKAWRATAHGLEVLVQPGNMWGPANNAHNVVVRAAPDPTNDEVEISVTVSNQPSGQYEQVDLVWYYDDSNMVKIGEELVDGKLCVVMGREENDKTRTINIIPITSTSVQLRLTVSGSRIRGHFHTPDMQIWRVPGECDLPVHGAPKISLQCYQGLPSIDHWARLTQFQIKRIPKERQD
jgi:regulation of enolase protein 1 (concanavalin A-like superfamily)